MRAAVLAQDKPVLAAYRAGSLDNCPRRHKLLVPLHSYVKNSASAFGKFKRPASRSLSDRGAGDAHYAMCDSNASASSG